MHACMLRVHTAFLPNACMHADAQVNSAESPAKRTLAVRAAKAAKSKAVKAQEVAASRAEEATRAKDALAQALREVDQAAKLAAEEKKRASASRKRTRASLREVRDAVEAELRGSRLAIKRLPRKKRGEESATEERRF